MHGVITRDILLDLLFTKEELVRDLIISGTTGHSDQEIVEVKIQRVKNITS